MEKYQSIQAMRGLATFLIVVAHAIEHSSGWGAMTKRMLDVASGTGIFGVLMFFTISGFILLRTSYENFGRQGSAGRFLFKRIIRIVPLYWLATLLEYGLRVRGGTAPDLSHLLQSMFFIPFLAKPEVDVAMRPVLGVGWTLNYEMGFYALFALTLVLRRRLGILVTTIVLAGLVTVGAAFKPLSDTSSPLTAFTFLTDPIILLFVAGMMLAVCERGMPSLRQRINKPVLVASTVMFATIGITVAWLGAYPFPLASQAAVYFMAVVCIGLCVFGDMRGGSHSVIRLARFLGDASYSIYLFHFFAIVAVGRTIPWADPVVFVGISSIAATAAGVLIYLTVEVPLTAALRRLSHPRSEAVAITA
ncbi:hypothetical protein N825_21830 [Skermanella stibiiresistens SB22]|uniref:Acyltransferase 3 domain-containing protein n=1 Tax=Skermanella stibiiresistens SB22 TaxID=1385369 RepID=W9GTI0_9PROT|nr:acyltransferase [Skermanella stibiiresistens]EWY37089.1 hypothetical protein N825_21830 [Skermanella stibiiresistens SB22]